MKKGTIIGIVLVILLGVFVLAAVVGVGLFTVKNQAVSVIGGADGPTAVFVAGKTGSGSILVPAIFAGIVLVVIVVAVIIIVKKNREE